MSSHIMQSSKTGFSNIRRKSSFIQIMPNIDYIAIISRAHQDLQQYLFNINQQFKKVIQHKQAQYLIAFKKHSQTVQKELIKLRDQFMKKKPDQSNQEVILMLEKQTALFRQQAIRTYYKLQQKQEQLKDVKFKLQITKDQLRYSQNTRKQLMKKLKSQQFQKSTQFQTEKKSITNRNLKTQISAQEQKNKELAFQIMRTQRSQNPQKSLIDRLYTSKYCPNKTARSRCTTSKNFFEVNSKNAKSSLNIFFTDFQTPQKDQKNLIRAKSFFDVQNLQKLKQFFKELVQLKIQNLSRRNQQFEQFSENQMSLIIKKIMLNKQNYKKFQQIFFTLKNFDEESQLNKIEKKQNPKRIQKDQHIVNRSNLRLVLKKQQIKKGKLSARDFGNWIKSHPTS